MVKRPRTSSLTVLALFRALEQTSPVEAGDFLKRTHASAHTTQKAAKRIMLSGRGGGETLIQSFEASVLFSVETAVRLLALVPTHIITLL